MELKYDIDLPGAGYDNKFCQTVKMHEDTEGAERQVVNLYPDISYETFEGFGGAVTESTGYLYSLLTKQQKDQLLQTYFTKEGMNYKLVRTHMDSCDFCLEMYEAMSNPQDTAFESFSFARTEKYILPMLEDIKGILGDGLKLMLTPWSPPVFMKTNGCRTGGGKLKPEYRGMWAEYLCSTSESLRTGVIPWRGYLYRMSRRRCRPGIPACLMQPKRRCF